MLLNYHLFQHSLQGEVSLQTQDLFPFIKWGLGKTEKWLPSVEKVSSQWTAKVDFSDAKQSLDIQLGTIDKVKFSGVIEKTKDINYEIIFVDNNSSDSSIEEVEIKGTLNEMHR